MDPTTALVIIVGVTLATRYLLAVGMVWLSKEPSVPVKVTSAILWTAVVIALFQLLLGKRGFQISLIATIWHYLVLWFTRNQKDQGEKDTKQ